jgi:hypothetical protein
MGGSERTRVRVNIVSVAGGVIGLLAAVFLPWVLSYSADVLRFWPSLTDLMTAPTGRTYGFFYMAGDATFLFGGILFISGAVVSFVTPLGGISQIAGWAIFYSTISQILGTHIGHPGILYTNYLGLGFWFGLIAGALCIISIIAPIGLGQPWKNLSLKERLLTLHKD